MWGFCVGRNTWEKPRRALNLLSSVGALFGKNDHLIIHCLDIVNFGKIKVVHVCALKKRSSAYTIFGPRGQAEQNTIIKKVIVFFGKLDPELS